MDWEPPQQQRTPPLRVGGPEGSGSNLSHVTTGFGVWGSFVTPGKLSSFTGKVGVIVGALGAALRVMEKSLIQHLARKGYLRAVQGKAGGRRKRERAGVGLLLRARD